MIYALVQAQRTTSRDVFVARLGVPVVVYKQQRVAASEVASLKTRAIDSSELAVNDVMLNLPKETHAYRVFRFTTEGAKRRIKVGRARDCDLVLNDKSVSSVHAFFDVAANNVVSVSDNASRNGSRLNDAALAAAAPASLQNGDTLMLGQLALQFFTPAGLYDFLQTLGAGGRQ